MNYECLICQVKALQQRLGKYEIPEEKRDYVAGEMLKEIAATDLETSYSPEITRNILARLREYSNVEDPYRKEKQDGNRLIRPCVLPLPATSSILAQQIISMWREPLIEY